MVRQMVFSQRQPSCPSRRILLARSGRLKCNQEKRPTARLSVRRREPSSVAARRDQVQYPLGKGILLVETSVRRKIGCRPFTAHTRVAGRVLC